VSFDPEPALSCHSQDRPRKGHWRPDIIKVKTDEYFKVFLPESHDSGVFIFGLRENYRKRTGFLTVIGCLRIYSGFILFGILEKIISFHIRHQF
jgi:hypothetical protein